MLRSLRFQLPAFFLLAAVIAGLVSAVIALRLFQSYAQTRAREQAYAELARETRGITELYQQRAGLKLLSAKNLERATGDNIFYVGLDPFPGQGPAFQRLPVKGAALKKVRVSHPVRIEFQRAGKQTLLGVARPLKIGSQTFGWIVVAKPKTVLNQHWFALIERLLIAFAGGLLVATAFAWYLSRRITSPVLELSQAADQVSRGHYDVAVPEVPGGGEIGLLADRFREMAARLSEAEELERNFLMSVSHELRTPLTAIRGHVEALREGVVTDEEMRLASLTVIAAEAERLERLVGDVLDLAKLDARRFTVLHEEVDMGRLVDRAFVDVRRGGEATWDRLSLRGGRQAGDRHRRRPCAPDHLEPALERLPLDSRRWEHRARAEGLERHGLRRGGRQRARDSRRGAGTDLPALLVA